MYVCTLCMCLVPEEGNRYPSTRVTNCCRYWELNLGPVRAANALSPPLSTVGLHGFREAALRLVSPHSCLAELCLWIQAHVSSFLLGFD